MADGLLNKASIILTPTGYKAGTLYNVAPIDEPYEDFDFARTSTATRINSSGLVSNIATGVPRINYDINGDNGHILLEPTSENKVTYSEDFSQWSNTDITFGTDGVSPSGVTNANFIQTGTAGNDQVSKAFALSPTNTTTYSVFIKRVGGAEWIDFLIVKSGFLNSLKVWFNINNGTVGGNNANGTTTLDSASIEDFGNDWYRLIVTTTDSTNNTSFNIRVRTASADGSDTRVNNSSYYLWGMQLEALPYATSYIPTLTGSTETRATETATGAGSADLINSTEGVLYAEIASLANDGINKYISINNGNSGLTDYIFFRYRSNDDFQIKLRSGNTDKVNEIFTLSNNLDLNKIAFSYKENEFKIFVNGSQVGATITSGATSVANTLSNIDFKRYDGASPFYGELKSLAVFNEALSDSELTQLTT